MSPQTPVTRVGFRLQVRRERLDEYRDHHVQVWPEMLDALTRCGWQRYSLFLDDDGTLFGYFETTDDLDHAVARMQAEPVNERWQALMGPFFEAGDGPADRQMHELAEIFHLP